MVREICGSSRFYVSWIVTQGFFSSFFFVKNERYTTCEGNSVGGERTIGDILKSKFLFLEREIYFCLWSYFVEKRRWRRVVIEEHDVFVV